jgi:hypothetical protein
MTSTTQNSAQMQLLCCPTEGLRKIQYTIAPGSCLQHATPLSLRLEMVPIRSVCTAASHTIVPPSNVYTLTGPAQEGTSGDLCYVWRPERHHTTKLGHGVAIQSPKWRRQEQLITSLNI